MDLKYYSNSHIEPIRKNLNTWLEITPAECNPLPVSEWYRWNLYFKDYAGIDVTKTLQFLIDNGYRLYEDAFNRWKRDPKKCHFVTTKQGVITIPCYDDNPRFNKDTYNVMYPNFDDFYITSRLKTMMILPLQKANPTSLKNQIIWVNDTHRKSKFLTICNDDTFEEWMKNNNVREGYYTQPQLDELLYPKALLFLQRKTRPHVWTTCKEKENNCWLCQRTTCGKRILNMPKFTKPKEALEGADLL